MNDYGFSLVEKVGGISCLRHRENQLQVLIAPSAVAPVVSFGIVYEVGSRYETEGLTGATHLLEHLMFKGTDNFNRERGNSAARLLQRAGASYNATTWLDRTSYFETLARDQLDLAVSIESDRMRNARVRPEDLADERGVVLNELDRGENDPFGLLLKKLFATAYTTHPYRHPTIGWRKDVENISASDLRSFYDTYYHPRNATVIVAGDLKEEEALETVARFFGEIPPGPEARSPEIVESEQHEKRSFEISRAGELAHIALAWHIPPGLDADMPALILLGQMLSDGVTSRLYQRLVEEKLCLSVHAYPLELHDPGVFQILATPAPGTESALVEAIIHEEIEKLASKPPSEEELLRARVQTRTDIAFRMESPDRLLSALVESVAMGDWRYFPGEMAAISAVEAEDISRVCARYLQENNLSRGLFIPKDVQS